MRRAFPLFLLAALLVSCVHVNVKPPQNQIVEAVGVASHPQLAALELQQGMQVERMNVSQPPDAGTWANRELTATATVPPPTFSPGVETRRLVSRRTALYEAYRDLASQIEQMRTPDGRTVGLAASDESLRRRIEELIQTNSRVVEESEQPTGSYYIKLALRTDPLASIVPVGPQPATSTLDAYETQRQLLRATVQQEAERDARNKLLQQVRTATYDGEQTIGERMNGDPQLSQRVMSLIQQAPVENVQFGRGGACQVRLALNLNQIRSGSR